MSCRPRRQFIGGIRWLAACILATGVLVGFAVPAAARELRIEQFDARVVVSADGTTEITETIQARFVGAWEGLYRTIPVEYHTAQGLNFTLQLDVVSVTDGTGAAQATTIGRAGHYRKLKIALPGATDASKTVVIKYRVLNALRFFEDHDELYWNITGDQWDVPLQDVTAHVTLPSGASGLRATDFTGVFGSRAQDADLQVQGNLVDFHTQRPLGFHEGLTIVVGWDKGAVRPPTWMEQTTWFLSSNWPLALPVIALVLMTSLWLLRGRDPRRRPIETQHNPPAGLTPAEAGTLFDDSVDMRDITATIVDLAIRGFVVIEEHPHESAIPFMSGTDYIFHVRKETDDWSALKPHERRLLSGMFSNGGRQSVAASDLENAFYQHVPAIKTSIYDALVRAGYYRRRPDTVRNVYLVAGILLGLFLVAGGIYASIKFGVSPVSFFIAGVATGLIVCAFSRIMPARTERGTRVLEALLGFERFIGQIEPSRSEDVSRTHTLFESTLPFAMAFGQESRLAKAFQSIYTSPPSWYVWGPNKPTYWARGFAWNIVHMTKRMDKTFASTPRSASSSGSGFGGRGSSGGGFGGGGGGGF